MNITPRLNRFKLVLFITVFFLVFAVSVQLQKPFGWDELEHIHSTYLIYQGKVPYRDFFQHHHPLMWYVYTPLFDLFQNKISALWAIKLLSIGIGMLNLLLLYRITEFYITSTTFRLLSIVLSITSIIFVFNEMEIRPDNLMLTFVLIGYLFLLRFFQEKKYLFLGISGISLGISFLFLQKAVIFIAIFNFILLFEHLIRSKYKKMASSVLILNGAVLAPIIAFLLLIKFSGIWSQYFFFNWTLNAVFDDVFSISRTFEEITLFNSGFFITLLGAIAFIFTQYKEVLSTQSLRILLITAILYVLSLVTVTRSPYSQYLLSVVFLGSIIIGRVFEQVYRGQFIQIVSISLIIFFCSFPVFFYKSYKIKDYTFIKQLEEIQIVEEKSEDEKAGLRIQEDMNIIYIDHSYYWFSPEGQRTIKRLETEGKLPNGIRRVK